MTFTDDALVLACVRFRERDKRVTLFTRAHGRVDCIAISACNVRSKLAGHLQPFRCVRVMVASGKQFSRVAQAVTQGAFTPFLNTQKTGTDVTSLLQRVRMMGIAGRFVVRTTEHGVPDACLFDTLHDAWKIACGTPTQNLASAFGAGLEALVSKAGYAPEFSRCTVCKRKEPDVSFRFFSLSLGGVICSTCPRELPVMDYTPHPDDRFRFLQAHVKWRDLL